MPQIFNQITQQLSDFCLLEKIIGADRYCFRFKYLSYIFQMHFDYYSQSIWIELEQDSTSNDEILQKLLHQLSFN